MRLSEKLGSLRKRKSVCRILNALHAKSQVFILEREAYLIIFSLESEYTLFFMKFFSVHY